MVALVVFQKIIDNVIRIAIGTIQFYIVFLLQRIVERIHVAFFHFPMYNSYVYVNIFILYYANHPNPTRD